MASIDIDETKLVQKRFNELCNCCDRKFANIGDFPFVRLEEFNEINAATLSELQKNNQVLQDFDRKLKNDQKDGTKSYEVNLLNWTEIKNNNKKESVPQAVIEPLRKHVEAR